MEYGIYIGGRFTAENICMI